MKNRYWFTNEDGENILNDFCGTEKEVVKYAEEQASALEQTIYINCGEDIVDVAYAQNSTGGGIIPTACNFFSSNTDTISHKISHDTNLSL